jgi:hypothetical protein
MSPKRQTKRKWIVHRRFEPNRLSPAMLVQAYAQVVPQYVRVLRLPADVPETPQKWCSDQKQGQLDIGVRPEIIRPAGYDRQVKCSLVIDAITKKEAC